MSCSVDTIEKYGMTATICYDEFCESPRETADNMWNFVSNMRRSSLSEGDLTISDLMENPKRYERDYVVVKVYAYIHSGIALSLTPFSCPWDSGLGFLAYVSKAQLRKEYGVKRVTKDTLERAMNVLKGEVQELGDWMDGDVYRVTIEDAEGDEVDGCGGFYGLESATEYANEMLEQYNPNPNTPPAESEQPKFKVA